MKRNANGARQALEVQALRHMRSIAALPSMFVCPHNAGVTHMTTTIHHVIWRLRGIAMLTITVMTRLTG